MSTLSIVFRLWIFNRREKKRPFLSKHLSAVFLENLRTAVQINRNNKFSLHCETKESQWVRAFEKMRMQKDHGSNINVPFSAFTGSYRILISFRRNDYSKWNWTAGLFRHRNGRKRADKSQEWYYWFLAAPFSTLSVCDSVPSNYSPLLPLHTPLIRAFYSAVRSLVTFADCQRNKWLGKKQPPAF